MCSVIQLNKTVLFMIICLFQHASSLCRACSKKQSYYLSDEFIDTINRANLSWRAKRNWPPNTTLQFLNELSGTIDEDDEEGDKSKIEVHSRVEIPETFDCRQKWPHCDSVIGKVRNQGACGSCWAVNSAAAMTDRLCIASNGSIKFEFSEEDILTCCLSCAKRKKRTCSGGKITAAWKLWTKRGFVSGGGYGSDEGCKPYSKDAFLSKRASQCKEFCTNSAYDKSYEDDKRFGKNIVILRRKGERSIQAEIMANGPVVLRFKVYADFYQYAEGIYYRKFGTVSSNFHAVKGIGWGVENNHSYWLVVNSWGKNWGDNKGFLKILRGRDECQIEQYAAAGLAELSPTRSSTKSSSSVFEANSFIIFLYVARVLSYF